MQWDEGKDNFIKHPPDATISVAGGAGSKVGQAVVASMKPKLDAGNLELAAFEASLGGASKPAAPFIGRGAGFGGDAGSRLGGHSEGSCRRRSDLICMDPAHPRRQP